MRRADELVAEMIIEHFKKHGLDVSEDVYEVLVLAEEINEQTGNVPPDYI